MGHINHETLRQRFISSQIYVQKFQQVCGSISTHTMYFCFMCATILRSVIIISIINVLSNELHCSQAPQRFVKIARVIRTIVRIHISMKRYLKEESNPTWSLLEMTLNLRNHFDKILSFRPTEQWVGIIVFFVSG